MRENNKLKSLKFKVLSMMMIRIKCLYFLYSIINNKFIKKTIIQKLKILTTIIIKHKNYKNNSISHLKIINF